MDPKYIDVFSSRVNIIHELRDLLEKNFYKKVNIEYV